MLPNSGEPVVCRKFRCQDFLQFFLTYRLELCSSTLEDCCGTGGNFAQHPCSNIHVLYVLLHPLRKKNEKIQVFMSYNI